MDEKRVDGSEVEGPPPVLRKNTEMKRRSFFLVFGREGVCGLEGKVRRSMFSGDFGGGIFVAPREQRLRSCCGSPNVGSSEPGSPGSSQPLGSRRGGDR